MDTIPETVAEFLAALTTKPEADPATEAVEALTEEQYKARYDEAFREAKELLDGVHATLHARMEAKGPDTYNKDGEACTYGSTINGWLAAFAGALGNMCGAQVYSMNDATYQARQAEAMRLMLAAVGTIEAPIKMALKASRNK